MFSRIVVPLDGTALAERAIPLAREIAGRAGGRLRLVRVHVPPRIPGAAPHVLGPRASEELKRSREEARKREREYLEDAGVGSGDGPDPEVSIALLRGPAGHSVVDDARRSDASLVILSAAVPGGDASSGLDETTDTVVRGCSSPVLVVRTPDDAGEDEPVGPRRLLVPLDGSRRAEAVLPAAEELARLFSAPVTLLRVLPEEEDGKEAERARRYLEVQADELRTRAVRVETSLHVGPPADVILREARSREVDLIAMASRCRGPLTRMVLGSVAAEVLRRAPVSVLIATPDR